MPVDAAEHGLEVMRLVRVERFGEVHDLFAPQLRDALTAEQLRDTWTDALARTGPITEIGDPITEPGRSQLTLVKIPVKCANEGFALVLGVDDTGWLWSWRLRALGEAQPWIPPDYADPTSFTESNVTVGSGVLAVPGILSMPATPGRRPAVVQLPGSGPMDRDSTLPQTSNKPLKDVAWGIASKGIAVLRFDKVTFTHPDKLDIERDATLTVEYIDHAIAAIRMLREHPSIDPARIFLLGHSEGGTVAPRIAAAEPVLAGLIILAGATAPLHHTMVRQYRYLIGLQPDIDVDTHPAVQEIIRQAALIDSPELSVSTPTSDLPDHLPAYRWIEMRDNPPTTTAAQLDIPMLILQGRRDYQVTVDDDLVGWQNDLGGRDDVTIRIYEADNHQFFSGSGPSTPMEYIPAQHVDPAVVADIADWVHSH
ncbi:alpha/beta hydrolase [Nocardia alni]|uniref:alpha/beta hydrolase n=1 Tax=Nocardia alni TaxID=2815723 RepID=UPI001C22E533|nr:alpha/beta hydrolase [Nocardia alni]